MFGNSFEKFIDAVKRGDLNCAIRMCQNEWIQKVNWDGWWPIHFACRYGHADVVQLLLDKGSQIEAETKWILRPIHFACANGNVAVVKLLLDRGAQIEAARPDGRQPIHFACASEHADVVQLLLDRGANMEIANTWDGWRPIHWACANGNAAVVKLLLDRGAKMEAENWCGRHPIYWACANGHTNVVQLLLDRGAQMEAADRDGWRPIHSACSTGNVALVQLLLDRGCEVHVRTKAGETPLHLTEKEDEFGIFRRNKKGKVKCARILMKAQKKPNIFDAARKDDVKMLESLLVPLWTKERKSGQTLLDVIVQANAKSIIEFLKRTPVSDKDVMDFLSLSRSDFSDKSYWLLRQWLVHCCIRHNIDWAFLRLCCVNVVNNSSLPDGKTCLDTAVEHRRSLCVRHILHKYVAPDESWDRARNVAMQKGYDEIVELIQHRYKVLQRNTSIGRNKLHLAVTEGDSDMVEYILRKGLEDHSQTNHNGDTPLMMAVANRMDECAAEIEKRDADMNTVNKHGQTILHAMVTGRVDVLPQWLIDKSLQVEQLDCMGLTALHQSILADLEGMAEQLIAIGANHRSVFQADTMAFSRLKRRLPLTAKENVASFCVKLHGRLYPSILNALDLNDIDFTDANGDSLLHFTARLLNEDECVKLLRKGANINRRNKMGRTPLVELLFQVEGKEMNIEDALISTVRCLVGHGADIKDEDCTGRTALQMGVGFPGPDAERLMLEMVRKGPIVRKFSQGQFGSCMQRKLCRFLEALLPLLTKKLAEELITTEAVQQSMAILQPSTTRTLFRCAGADVQKAFLDEMLRMAAHADDEEYFHYLLQYHNADWTVMANGETILTELLKERNTKFSRPLLNTRNTSRLVQLTNRNGDSALMVAINEEVDEVIDDLILETDALDIENNDGSSALSLLFQRVSVTQENRQTKLSLWIRQLISKSANIYKQNRNGLTAISFCTNGALRSDFELFYNKKQRKEIRETTNADTTVLDLALAPSIVCTVCMYRPINSSLCCGHMFCMDCVETLCKCPDCQATDMTATRLFFN